jgi:transcriptional regulator with XRE-family HTH domain
MEKIGDRIRKVRKTFHLTQKKFGERLNISNSHISGVELNNDIPSDSLVKLICMEFGVNKKWLISGEGEMLLNKDLEINNDNIETFNEVILRLTKILASTTSPYKHFYIVDSVRELTELLSCNNVDLEFEKAYFEFIKEFLSCLLRMNFILSTSKIPEHHDNPNYYEEDLRLLQEHKDSMQTIINKIYELHQKHLDKYFNNEPIKK